jgi:micrococcal nuclease
MKKGAVAIAGLFLVFAAQAQKEIPVDSLSRHIGDSVTVCTKIYGGIFLERSNGTPTFLNAGAAYPNAPLTIVIWADARGKFKDPPEVYYKDKNVCITGKIILYREKPEIVLYDEKQIIVK